MHIPKIEKEQLYPDTSQAQVQGYTQKHMLVLEPVLDPEVISVRVQSLMHI